MDNPNTELSDRQAQKIKKYVKEFLDKAVVKYNGHQGRKAADGGKRSPHADAGSANKASGNEASSTTPVESPPAPRDAVENGTLSDGEKDETPSDIDRKRKRGDDDIMDSAGATPSDNRDLKRLREEDTRQSITPPPPPPPPASTGAEDTMSDEQRALQEQEEALMRENEEAQRLEDEANKTKHMEEAAEAMQKEMAAAEGKRSAPNQEVMSH